MQSEVQLRGPRSLEKDDSRQGHAPNAGCWNLFFVRWFVRSLYVFFCVINSSHPQLSLETRRTESDIHSNVVRFRVCSCSPTVHVEAVPAFAFFPICRTGRWTWSLRVPRPPTEEKKQQETVKVVCLFVYRMCVSGIVVHFRGPRKSLATQFPTGYCKTRHVYVSIMGPLPGTASLDGHRGFFPWHTTTSSSSRAIECRMFSILYKIESITVID